MRRHRSAVWLLVFAMLLVSAACRTSNADPSPTPTPEVTAVPRSPSPTSDSPTPTPQATITVEAYPSATPRCPGVLPTRLILQERAWVLNDDPRPLNIRAGPGTEWRVLGSLQPHQVFLVVSGPVCSDPYVWYEIRFLAIDGWIAESDRKSYYVEPYLPG